LEDEEEEDFTTNMPPLVALESYAKINKSKF